MGVRQKRIRVSLLCLVLVRTHWWENWICAHICLFWGRFLLVWLSFNILNQEGLNTLTRCVRPLHAPRGRPARSTAQAVERREAVVAVGSQDRQHVHLLLQVGLLLRLQQSWWTSGG